MILHRHTAGLPYTWRNRTGVPIVLPVISGTPLPGNTLTSTQLGQWLVNGVEVANNTTTTYVVQEADIGYGIQQYSSNILTVPAPVLTGNPIVGNTVSSTYAIQWYVNGVAVPGETGSTYVVRYADMGYDITQTRSNVLTVPYPVITGTPIVGNTLTSTVAGQWRVNGVNVSGETGTTYVVREADISYGINQPLSNTLTVPYPVVSGTAFPGNTLTSTQPGQWYVNGSLISGQTGSTFVIRLDDIGYPIKQTYSNTLTCWSPVDIAAVAGFWTPYRNVYTSTGPNVAATDGDPIARWTDIKNGITADTTNGVPLYDTSGTYPFVLFDVDAAQLTFSDLTVFKNKTYGEILWSGKVIQNGTSSSNFNSIVAFKTNSTFYPRLALLSRKDGLNGLWARTHPVDSSTAKTTANDGSIVGTNCVLNARAEWMTGGNVTVSKNNATGQSTATNSTGNSPNTDSVAATMGLFTGYSGTAGVNGEYRCVCLVNAALTATERSQLSRYMGLFVGVSIAIV